MAKALGEALGLGWASVLADSASPSGKVFEIVGTGGGGIYSYSKAGGGIVYYTGYNKIGQVSLQTMQGVEVEVPTLRIAVNRAALSGYLEVQIREGATVLATLTGEDAYDQVITIGGSITGLARVLEVYARNVDTPSGGVIFGTFIFSGALTLSAPTVTDDFAIRMMGGLLN